MQALLAPLKELAEFGQMQENLRKLISPIALTGCVDSQKLHMMYGLSDGCKYTVIVTYSDLKAKELYEEYKFYDRNVMLYPAKDLIFFQADIHGNQLTRERICTLRRLIERKPTTIITTFAALMAPQVLWDEEKDVILVERGGNINETYLAQKLVSMGYEKTYQVENPGQFSIRGGIVDVYDLTEENPYRIELWGDEVDSIRSFDILSQRSIEKLESITIYPATEFVMEVDRVHAGLTKLKQEADRQSELFRKHFQTEEAHRVEQNFRELQEQLLEFQSKVNIESYIRYFYDDPVTLPELMQNISGGKGLTFFIDEPGRVKEQADAVELEFRESMQQRAEKGYILPGQMNILFNGEQVASKLMHGNVVTLSIMDGKSAYFKSAKKYDINVRNVAPYNNSFEALVKDLKQYRKK
ncbi:MAG: transcription-repair coupling factor, partial [Acetatifactor sp.]|nr:transcription-repair coupling factor [Acetatifactor sp.]